MIFFVSHKHARSYLNGLGFWMLEAVDSLESDEVCGLVSSFGKLFVEAADGNSQIVCEHGSYNEPMDQLPEVLPHEIACTEMRQFDFVLQLHRVCMLSVFKDEGIGSISQQFSQFLQSIQQDPQFKEKVVGKADAPKSFQ